MTIDDWEPLAKERLTDMAYAYLVGGAGDEVTLRGNREGFARIRLRPRMLVDVSEIDTATVLFGQTLKMPVLLAPVAYQKIVHPEGELEAVRGANAAGIRVHGKHRGHNCRGRDRSRADGSRHGSNSTRRLTGHLRRLSSIVPGKPAAVCFASQWTRPYGDSATVTRALASACRRDCSGRTSAT